MKRQNKVNMESIENFMARFVNCLKIAIHEKKFRFISFIPHKLNPTLIPFLENDQQNK